MLISVRLRDDGSGGGIVGVGGNDKNLAGSLGTQRPVGLPIVVMTQSHPNSSNNLTPFVVPAINPRTKKAVPLRDITLLCSAIQTMSLTIPDISRNGTPPSLAPMFPIAQRQDFNFKMVSISSSSCFKVITKRENSSKWPFSWRMRHPSAVFVNSP